MLDLARLRVSVPSLLHRRAAPLCGVGCVRFGSAVPCHHGVRGSSVDTHKDASWSFNLGRLCVSTRERTPRFVAEGILVSHGSGDKWGGTAIVIREGRVVMKLTNIHVAAARMLYPNNQGVDSTWLKDARIGELVLWDVVS